MVIYLSLYKIYLQNFFELHPEMKLRIIEKTQMLFTKMNLTEALWSKVLADLRNKGLFDVFSNFDNTLKGTSLFLRNYMLMYEVLLDFVRANHEENWNLHLTSLDAMIPYFFAHDQINYARHAPLYLATMREIQTKDIESQNYLKENFSINKTSIPFCSISTDHALEQENKILKINGGVKALTQNTTALHRFCLIAPSLNSLLKEFLGVQNMLLESSHRQHYQLNGSTNKRITNNIHNVVTNLCSFKVTFHDDPCLYNLVSQAVLPDDSSAELLKHHNIGKDLYKSFISERLLGEESVWSSLKKRNLKTFHNHAKTIKTKVKLILF